MTCLKRLGRTANSEINFPASIYFIYFIIASATASNMF